MSLSVARRASYFSLVLVSLLALNIAVTSGSSISAMDTTISVDVVNTAHTQAPIRTLARAASSQLRGLASWHDTGRHGAFAAAGPLLRRALGRDWRGRHVLVCLELRCVEVHLNDWCLCPNGPRLVDLSDEAFRYLAPLSRGLLRVTVDAMR
jgi:rare lipoprotein A (peptidoglycan hydrolase)